MDFNQELIEFPSALHSNIYSRARSVMPLSPMADSDAESALYESYVALHGFVMGMLSDMYDHPDAYRLLVMKLEEFYNGQALAMKRESPKEFKKIFTQTYKDAGSYLDLLCQIGSDGRVEGDAFIISDERFQAIRKKVKPKALKERLEALGRMGFMMETASTGEYRFTSNNYPNMFSALHSFANKGGLDVLDFRTLGDAHKPSQDDFIESLTYPLIAGQREMFRKLHHYATECKMRPTTDANKGVTYHYKGNQVMRVGAGDDLASYLSVKVLGKDKKDDLQVVDDHLTNEPRDFQEQVRQRLTGCDANQCVMCSTFASGNYVTVLGQRHQMCGAGILGFCWHNPSEDDMATIRRLMDIRREIIGVC